MSDGCESLTSLLMWKIESLSESLLADEKFDVGRSCEFTDMAPKCGADADTCLSMTVCQLVGPSLLFSDTAAGDHALH